MEETIFEEKKDESIVSRAKQYHDLGVARTNRKRVVILGGGFAGLHLVKNLRKGDYQIVLIDKHNHHNFQPLLYQVATSGLEADSIAYPLRKALANHKDYHFRMGTATAIQPEENKVVTTHGEISYDYLVIATGAKTNYFGLKNVEKYAMPMKSLAEAMTLRNAILQNYESALLTNDAGEREQLMNIVIAGGGPTGVELAGALAEFRKYIMPKDYPDLDFEKSKIYLVELLPKLLSPMSEEASAKSREYLGKMGVIIKTETEIEDYDGDIVKTNQGNIPAKLLVWTGGVAAASLPGFKEEVMDKGRYICDEFARVSGYENIFALGDVAEIRTEKYPEGHPQLASLAVDQGKFLAGNLKALLEKGDVKPFIYKDRGTMATVGTNKAVVDLPGWKFQGAFAWFVWLGVHLFSLIGFRNKVITFTNWIWNYFNRDRETRLIIKD